ncbi:Agamous-like MADS-box protein AGL29 [Linum grandiflorum]
MGRRKIEMKMVADKNCRQVTFSKRRTGLFKKAHELATLCAVQIAILVFSPGGKPFSFGSPDFDSVADKFLNEDGDDTDSEEDDDVMTPETKRKSRRLDTLRHRLDLEKKRAVAFREGIKKAAAGLWFKKPVTKMGLEELAELKEKLVKYRGDKVGGEALEVEASMNLLFLSKQKPVDVMSDHSEFSDSDSDSDSDYY